MILLKFGKKEHLEQLKSGSVHFRPVEYFQNEPTDFRGDSMEGTIGANGGVNIETEFNTEIPIFKTADLY